MQQNMGQQIGFTIHFFLDNTRVDELNSSLAFCIFLFFLEPELICFELFAELHEHSQSGPLYQKIPKSQIFLFLPFFG